MSRRILIFGEQNNLTSKKEVPCGSSDQTPTINDFQVQGLYCVCVHYVFSIPRPLCGHSVAPHREKKEVMGFFGFVWCAFFFIIIFVSLPCMLLSKWPLKRLYTHKFYLSIEMVFSEAWLNKPGDVVLNGL